MIKEFGRIDLTCDVTEHGLKRGDLGTVVMDHDGGGYEPKCMALDGETDAIVSLRSA